MRATTAYVSSYVRPGAGTTAPAPGVHVLTAGADGRLDVRQNVGSPDPTWLTLHPTGTVLYACYSPAAPGAGCTIEAHRVEDDGLLTPISRTGIGPGSPAQTVVHPTGRYLVVADYGAGEYQSFQIEDDGSLGDIIDTVRGTGSGPHPRQDAAHPHAVAFDPTGTYLVTADLGADLVQVFRLVEGRFRLTSEAPVHRGSGPRHVAFARTAPVVYVVGELDGTITVLPLDPGTGTLGASVQRVATAPQDYAGVQSGAEIAVAPNGLHLYASNRGSQSIAAYAIAQDTGLLTPIGHVTDGVAGPTSFALAPNGHRLYVNSSEADLIVPFVIDPAAGTLTRDGIGAVVCAPNVMVFG